MIRDLVGEQEAYKCRFLVRSGRGFISINTEDVAYIMSENKLNYLVIKEGKKYAVDHTLEQLQNLLDPKDYQRINQNFIVSSKSIKRIEPYFNNRMLINLDPPCPREVLVGRNYLKEFNTWINL